MKNLKCQICNCEINLNDIEELDKNVPIYDFCPSSKLTCSYKCQANALRINGAWILKELLRNISSIPYQEFRNLFNFNEEGAYCEKKYELMRSNSFVFLCSLDSSNFIKLMNYKLK